MAAAPAKDTEDVMKFLDGLDDLVPATAPTSAAAASNPATASSPASGQPTGAAKPKPKPSDADVLSFLDELKADQPPSDAKTEPVNQPAQPNTADELSAKAWGWAGNLWSTAQATASKVSSTAVASLQMAEAMVEETLTSDTVKGLAKDVTSTVSSTVSGVVKSETVGKLTQDISNFTINTVNSVADVIAPPIESPSYRGGNSSISHMLFADASKGSTSNLPPVAGTITVWLCAELQEDEPQQATEQGMVPQSPADMIHDFVQGTANSLWLHGGGAIPGGSGRAIGKRIVVNSVTDPSPRPARGVQEAVKVIEATVQRLAKLAEANEAETSPQPATDDGAPQPPNVTLFLVIQPYTTLIPSPLQSTTAGSATALHRHYLTMLVNPKTKSPGLDVVSAVSQSVRADKGGKTFGGKEMVPALKKLMDKWSEEQVMRVVEVAVNDVLEEFSLRSKGVDAL
ncbi:hypothetical protein HDU99_003555 [Rhizoclosmatium hyalinum]|nr:hypothetical protein HDU99_003555 [Rhizoclosmatium hyalinum]